MASLACCTSSVTRVLPDSWQEDTLGHLALEDPSHFQDGCPVAIRALSKFF